jgi:diguanylate cyclase (GGDEF)-like protein
VHRRAGAFDAAQAALDRSYRLAEEYALTGLMIQILQEQAELFAAQTRYKDAFETFRDFHLADVELRAVERDSRARTLNAIFEATEARRSSDYFRELSVRDPLTGLHNRRHLDARLSDLLTGATRSDAGLTLGLIDLDHFKRINDTRSHAVGDEVLRRVAGLLQDAAASVPDGLAVRMGGEEFLVLLPGLCGDAGLERMQGIRRDIAGYPWGPVTDDLAVTASIGIAEAPRDGCDERTLLAVADRNLYRAKSDGRDQVQGSADLRAG